MKNLCHFPFIFTGVIARHMGISLKKLFFTRHPWYALIIRLVHLGRAKPIWVEDVNGIHERVTKRGKFPVQNSYDSWLCRVKDLYLSVLSSAAFQTHCLPDCQTCNHRERLHSSRLEHFFSRSLSLRHIFHEHALMAYPYLCLWLPPVVPLYERKYCSGADRTEFVCQRSRGRLNPDQCCATLQVCQSQKTTFKKFSFESRYTTKQLTLFDGRRPRVHSDLGQL